MFVYLSSRWQVHSVLFVNYFNQILFAVEGNPAFLQTVLSIDYGVSFFRFLGLKRVDYTSRGSINHV